MNITGAGLDMMSLMKSEPMKRVDSSSPASEGTAPANRINGTDSKKLESKDSFKRIFNEKVESKAKPSAEKTSEETASEEVLAPVTYEAPKVQSAEKSKTAIESLDEVELSRPVLTGEETAMIKFLFAMKTELGVEPEQVVEAMASLTADSLVRPPEETMEQVIEQLDLSPAQEVKAEELYQVMLKDTAQASMGEMLQEKNQTAEFAVVGPEQVKLKKLLNSLDDLNTNFFASQSKVASATAQQVKVDQKTVPQKAPDGWADNSFATLFQPREIVSRSEVTPGPIDPASMVASVKPEAAPGSVMASETHPDALPIEDLIAQLNVEGFKVDSADQEVVQQIVKPEAKSPEIEPLADKSSVLPLETETAVTKTDSNNFSQEQSLESKSEDTLHEPAVATQPAQKTEFVNSLNNARPGTPVLKTSDEAANTRNIIETAQLLAHKGGGSMKIQLRPEGMGFVELKVGVADGKVDIQMIAENNETKRLLESGLSELKSGLVQHKLTLENIQVNTNNNTNPGFDSMLGQDRETARQFLESFREFNQNRREAAFDFGGAANGTSQNKRLRPEDVKYGSAKAKGASRRLDLVA